MVHVPGHRRAPIVSVAHHGGPCKRIHEEGLQRPRQMQPAGRHAASVPASAIISIRASGKYRLICSLACCRQDVVRPRSPQEQRWSIIEPGPGPSAGQSSISAMPAGNVLRALCAIAAHWSEGPGSATGRRVQSCFWNAGCQRVELPLTVKSRAVTSQVAFPSASMASGHRLVVMRVGHWCDVGHQQARYLASGCWSRASIMATLPPMEWPSTFAGSANFAAAKASPARRPPWRRSSCP